MLLVFVLFPTLALVGDKKQTLKRLSNNLQLAAGFVWLTLCIRFKQSFNPNELNQRFATTK